MVSTAEIGKAHLGLRMTQQQGTAKCFADQINSKSEKNRDSEVAHHSSGTLIPNLSSLVPQRFHRIQL
jgi:hypothetical protein